MRMILIAMVAACGGGSGGGASVDGLGHRGTVVIQEQDFDETVGTSHFANFTDVEATFSTRTDGPCRIDKREAEADAVTFTEAGEVTITGAGSPIVLRPDPMDQYSSDSQQGFLYAQGELVTITASGGNVPAFTGTVTYPPQLIITSGLPMTITGDLTPTWMPLANDVEILILQDQPGFDQVTIRCTLPGSPGEGTVPVSAMTDLVSIGTAVIIVSTIGRTEVTAGNYVVSLEAQFVGTIERASPELE